MEHDVLVVDIGQLRRAAEIALKELERVSGSKARLERDFFWVIPSEERFNPYERPMNATVGQLSELIDHVAALDSDPERVSRQHLVWIGELLMAIGELLPD